MSIYDYIVVGAGSSGCVVTNRLINANKSVLLLEAGSSDSNPFIHIPATFSRVLGTHRSWMYLTEPEPGAGNRRLTIPQGRTLGGSSSINAMIYIRGQAEDYDTWRDQGCVGWGFDDVLPVFKRSEANQRLADSFHGTQGLLKVSDASFRHPISDAFVRGAQEVGYNFNHDFNGAMQDGIGFYQTTTELGRRASLAATYLKAVRKSPLLTVQTNCAVTGVTLENGAATGISYRAKDGSLCTASVREEVILAAGALATPKILMLSGIGPAKELAAHGIPVVRDLQGVGENFQDHLAASVYGITDRPISLLGQDTGFRALRHLLEYLATRRGLLSSNIIETGGFIDTSGSGRPDIQIHVTPALVGDADRKPMSRHGMSINPCILRPSARGKVTLRSSKPDDPIRLSANSLGTREDVDTLVRGLEVARRILRSPALKALGFSEMAPEPGEAADREALETYARQNAKTVYHPSGTCKMGDDDMAVVDPQLRVIGVPRLRVTDVSVMPTIVSGNTNAPAVMIAERCADFMLGAR